jgi:hypothetical protein
MFLLGLRTLCTFGAASFPEITDEATLAVSAEVTAITQSTKTSEGRATFWSSSRTGIFSTQARCMTACIRCRWLAPFVPMQSGTAEGSVRQHYLSANNKWHFQTLLI